MTIDAAPFAGDLNFEPNEYNRCYFNVDVPSGQYDININLKSGELADGLAKACPAVCRIAIVDAARETGLD